MLFSLLLLACNKERETVAPAGASVSQDSTGPGTDPPIDPAAITPLYTDNVIRSQASSTNAPMSFAPGARVYFLTRAINTPTSPVVVGTTILTNYDTHLVQLEIAGTNGSTFYMLADRAGVIDDYGEGQTNYFTPPNAPFTGFYSQGYRGMAWKIPPYMPAGTYRVRFYSYQGGSPVPQMFSGNGANVAEGSLVVNSVSLPATPTLQYAPPVATASSPIFGLSWFTSEFSGSSATPELRVMVRNTTTNKFYALSPGYNDMLYFPTWDANATYSNTGGASVRYNSTTLFGGLTPPYTGPTTSANTPQRVPAGYYQVYVDDKNEYGSLPTKYLTTSLTPFVPLQLF